MEYIRRDYDDSKSNGPCDCCGDWIDSFYKTVQETTVLWLDDERDSSKEDYRINYKLNDYTHIVWVRSYEEFVFWINTNGLPDCVCFDNDLGTTLEGYDAAKWLTEYCQENNLKFPEYRIQSANPVAVKKNISSYIENYKKHCEDDIS